MGTSFFVLNELKKLAPVSQLAAVLSRLSIFKSRSLATARAD
jgi:hypothetical protein